jgi:hypothetical protein
LVVSALRFKAIGDRGHGRDGERGRGGDWELARPRAVVIRGEGERVGVQETEHSLLWISLFY